jgi:hypothetical protein
MSNRSAIRVYAVAAALVLWAASPALAQFQPRPLNDPDPATGERFHIEGFAGFWNPRADMVLSSESLGIPGTTIDFTKDLGLKDQRFSDLRLVLRPALKHKFRFQSTPIAYGRDGVTVTRDIVFNGQRYSVNVPVDWALDWQAYRFGYEYDFIVKNRGFGGFILEAKYTDVTATLATPFFSEFAHARAPIPSIGGIVRVYVVPNISITGEVSGFKLPESVVEGYQAHYIDYDIYGTVNFTNNVGAQIGWRSIDVGYVVEEDIGSFVVRGLYFGIVARY